MEIDQVGKLRRDIHSYKSSPNVALSAMKRLEELTLSPQSIKKSRLITQLKKISGEKGEFGEHVKVATAILTKWKNVIEEDKKKGGKQQQDTAEKQVQSVRERLKKSLLTRAEELSQHPQLQPFLKSLQEALDKLGNKERTNTLCKLLRHTQATTDCKLSMLDGRTPIVDIIACKPQIFSKEQAQKASMAQTKLLQTTDVDFWSKKKQQIHSEGKGIKCKFCKKPCASVTNMLQIRASDEPMTIFYKCFACQRNWKE